MTDDEAAEFYAKPENRRIVGQPVRRHNLSEHDRVTKLLHRIQETQSELDKGKAIVAELAKRVEVHDHELCCLFCCAATSASSCGIEGAHDTNCPLQKAKLWAGLPPSSTTT